MWSVETNTQGESDMYIYVVNIDGNRWSHDLFLQRALKVYRQAKEVMPSHKVEFVVEWYALEAWRVVDVEGGDDFIV